MRRAATPREGARELRARFGISSDKKVILYASKLIARKRPLDLLQAYAIVRARRDDVALLFVGSGEEEGELWDIVSERHVPDVHFAGFRNQSELPEIYAASDVFVLPAENEPWGLVINEVMCAGLPVVTSEEVGAVPDLVHHGDNGFLYPAGDVSTLAGYLETLLADNRLRARMGERSLELIGDWDLDRCVAGVRAALELVAPEGRVGQTPVRETVRS
jgi:glycosyltransferase involved in cell wall biosynthesis